MKVAFSFQQFKEKSNPRDGFKILFPNYPG